MCPVPGARKLAADTSGETRLREVSISAEDALFEAFGGLTQEDFEYLSQLAKGYAGPGETADIHDVLEHFAGEPTSAPPFLRKNPLFKYTVQRLERQRRLIAEQSREHARQVKAAKARAQQHGVRCWGALLDAATDPHRVQRLETLLVAKGWLDTRWQPVDEDARWPLRFDAVVGSSSQGTREVGVGWTELLPLVESFADNEPALALAIALRWQLRMSLRVPLRLSPRVAERVLQTLYEMKRVSGLARNTVLDRLSFSSWQVLARAPQALRWALLYEVPATNVGSKRSARALVTPRLLNRAQFEKAQKSPAARLEALPPSLQWQQLTGLPAPSFELPNLYGLKFSTVRKLLAVAKLPFDKSLCADAGNLHPLLNLVRLFSDEASIQRFVKAAGHLWDRKGLHDAGQFVLPARGWTPSKWAPLCLKYPRAVRYARDFAALEASGVQPSSWSQLQLAVLSASYPPALPGHEPLRDFCLRSKLSASAFEEAQRFWSTAQVKSAEFLPQIRILGEELGLSNEWAFERLASDDIRGPLLGQLTGCCQHLSGAGSSCARHGVLSPYSAFYVLTFRGQVFAQSWAWRSLRGALVWDSIESRPADETETSVIARVYAEASRRALQGPLGVSAVYLGYTDSGVTARVGKALAPDWVAQHAEVPADTCDYLDGRAQVLLSGKARKSNVKWAPVEGYNRTPGRACDTLLSVQADAWEELQYRMRFEEEGWSALPGDRGWAPEYARPLRLDTLRY